MHVYGEVEQRESGISRMLDFEFDVGVLLVHEVQDGLCFFCCRRSYENVVDVTFEETDLELVKALLFDSIHVHCRENAGDAVAHR